MLAPHYSVHDAFRRECKYKTEEQKLSVCEFVITIMNSNQHGVKPSPAPEVSMRGPSLGYAALKAGQWNRHRLHKTPTTPCWGNANIRSCTLRAGKQSLGPTPSNSYSGASASMGFVVMRSSADWLLFCFFNSLFLFLMGREETQYLSRMQGHARRQFG